MGGAPELETVHATALAFADMGILIRGPSGSGKSDLALRCLAQPQVATPHAVQLTMQLIADDRVALHMTDGFIELSCPPQLAGKLEVRGLGIVAANWVRAARLALVVDLVPQSQPIERMPETDLAGILGVAVPRMELHPFEASAPLKLLLAMTTLRPVA